MEEKLYPSDPSLSSYSSTEVESMINKQFAKEPSFINSIQKIMMKFYEVEEKNTR